MTRATSGTATGTSVVFETWYRSIHPRLVAAMVLTTGRAEDAADAADEALARALERWDQVGQMASPDGWTFQVAYNIVRRRARRRALEERVLRRAATGRATSVPAPAGEAWDAVKHLPSRQREVVVLRYIADLPDAQIAVVLGISRGTVSSTLTDARRALGTMLEDPDDDRSDGRADGTGGGAGDPSVPSSAGARSDTHAPSVPFITIDPSDPSEKTS